jgi:hypothetical protein
MRNKRFTLVACAALLGLALVAAPAQADRALLSEELLETSPGSFGVPPVPPPEGQIEGACGLAVAPAGIYVSDYYHRMVDRFKFEGGKYLFERAISGFTAAPEGPCGLALAPGGTLYANVWHQSVVRLEPSFFVLDSGEPTGVAVDASGDVYVNDRTHVTRYAAPVTAASVPVAQIGLGSLGDAYGLAVFGGRAYVPDASTDTVKVYEPATDLDDPVDVIDGSAVGPGGFASLVDAAVAVDPTNGHVLVVDNPEPGFEHPQAAVYEFDSSGAYLGRLAGSPVHGEPSGIAVGSDGSLYVTDGNDEESNVYAYGPYVPLSFSGGGASPSGTAAPSPASPSAAPVRSGPPAPRRTARSPRSAHASEVTQRGRLRVSFTGEIVPRALPRHGSAPVSASVGGRIATTDGSSPPQLRRISIAINRFGRIDATGLPVCRLQAIDPSTSEGALEACRSSLVGQGRFSARVKLPQQSPFPSRGRLLAFNGRLGGRPVILAHVFGTKPVPTSYVLSFSIGRARGTYGTVLEASLPQVTGDWGYVTGLDLRLERRFSFRGERRSYVSAGCPAPQGFPGAVFPFARTVFSFAGGPNLSSTLTRSCKVR